MPGQQQRRKVLLIGLDAAESTLLQAGMDGGTLPVLGRLRRDGAWGIVASPAGFGSGAVWPSFATGVSPAKHGRYFYRQVHAGDYAARYFEATEFRATPLWERLSAAGRAVAVFDVPKMGLSTDIDGIMAVDWIAHGGVYGKLHAVPEAFADELTRRFGTDPLPKCDLPGMRSVDEHRLLLRQLHDRIGQRERCTRHYLAERDWDLFVTVFAEPHCVGHQAWHVRDRNHPLHDAAALATLGDPVLDVYRAIDASIGRMIAGVDDDTTVIVFSGTGMGPNYTGNYLLDEVLRRIDGIAATRRASLVRSLKLRAKRVMPREVRRRARPLKRRVEEAAQSGDRARRRSFAVPHNDITGAVRLNIAGREPNGILRPEEVVGFVDKLRAELMALRNADTGGPVVERVVRVADESSGPHLDDLPDLFVMWHRDAPIDRVQSPTVGTVEYVHRGNRTGDHRQDSMFVAVGPGVVPGEIAGTTVYDFAPTLGAILGVPVDDTDGTEITALLPRRDPDVVPA
jgi:predicted AlkP superfamily phosphohydrolase/phosphomutase